MFASARHDAILRELDLRGSLEVTKLSERLGVSSMTIRRDLADLEKRGLLVRVHGGAISPAVAAQREPARPATRALRRPVATIGMVTPTAKYYFPEVIAGVRQMAAELNCRIVLGTTDYSSDEEYRQAARLIAGGVDALIITPSEVRIEGTPLHELLVRAPIPVVVVERAVDERSGGHIESVRTDHAYGAELAVRHLAELGHRRIALAAPQSPTSPWLVDGYELAMRRLGLGDEIAPYRELPLTSIGLNVSPAALESLLEAWVADGVTGALVLSDVESVALVELAADRGIDVPRDLSIIAYDDEIAALASVPLTAISPPKRELGQAAMRLAFDRIRRPDVEHRSITRTAMLPRLIERESTSAPLIV